MKSLINIPLFKEQLKRFWAIGVVFTIIYLLVALSTYSTADVVQAPQHLARAMISLLSMTNNFLILSMLIGPLCVAMALYPYHFSTNAATAFHTFPVTKKQLFWTNMTAALILMLLPLIIFCLVILIPVRYPGYWVMDYDGVTRLWTSHIHFPHTLFSRELIIGDTINTFPVVAGFFARLAVGFIFYYSVFLLAVSVSGNRVVAILICGALPLIPVGLYGLITGIASIFVFGYDGINTAVRAEQVLAYSNPVMWVSAINGQPMSFRFFRVGMSITPSALLQYFVSYIGIAAALTTIAYACSHRRKQERTGDSVVFTAFNYVLVFLVAMMGMLGIGAFLMAITRSMAGLYVGFVLGFVIFYFIAQMIAEKSFNVAHKVKSLLSYGGVMIALYMLILAVTHFGMAFYVNHVPQAQEVAGVSLGNRWRRTEADQRPVSIYASDPAAINHTLEIHRQIIDNRQYLRRVHQRIMAGNWGNTLHFPIMYLMHDGTTMYREYILSVSFAESVGYFDLMGNPAIVISNYPIFERPEIIEEIQIHYWEDDNAWVRDDPILITINNRAEIISFLDTMSVEVIRLRTDPTREQRASNMVTVEIRVSEEDRFRYRVWDVPFWALTDSVLEWLDRYGYTF